MRTTELHIAPRPARSSRRREPHRDDRIVTRLLSLRIDRDLGQPTLSRSSITDAARALQCMRPRRRHSLARFLKMLIEQAQDRSPSDMRAPIHPCRAQVRDALPKIMATCAWLRTAEPVDARGVAMLRAVLTDRRGPCNVRSHPTDRDAARRVAMPPRSVLARKARPG